MVKRGGPPPPDPLVELVKTATWLRARGRADAYDLSPRQIAFAARVEEEAMRRDTLATAIATAVGTNGDKKAWAALSDGY